MKRPHIFLALGALIGLAAGCAPSVQDATPLGKQVTVWPDVAGITVPCNLAPVRFAVPDSCGLTDVQAVFKSSNTLHVVAQRSGQISIDVEGWQSLIAGQDSIMVTVQGRRDGQWYQYDPMTIYVSDDSIDPYLSYRLIEPGYEVWGKMGIYQRRLSDYDETPILENTQTKGGCMNCHTYCAYNPDQMLLHLRQECGGTYVLRQGQVEKLNTKTEQTVSPLVYPSWHPSGRYVAFSTNVTRQSFHSTDLNRIEVFDKESDIVIYDVEKHQVFSCPMLKSAAAYETFPSFSPDGKTLYFCSADSVSVLQHYDSVHYSLCSIAFDAEAAPTACFGTDVDTLYNARTQGGSVSFPRVSPDGMFLLYTLSAYGNFSIWHRDADLYMIDLTTRQIRSLDECNSEAVESFHSWSSNGRWVVFSSRRDDGLYTRPYLTHVDAAGRCSKPFRLPQSDLRHDALLMKSYNLPEFMHGAVHLPGSFSKQAQEDPGIQVNYLIDN